jgi:hypothetical protein
MITDPNPTISGGTTCPQASSCQPLCPVCSGLLIPQRSTWRCSRCCYTFCEGCENDTPEDFPAEVE